MTSSPSTDWTPQSVNSTSWEVGGFTSEDILLLQSGDELLLQNNSDRLGLQS